MTIIALVTHNYGFWFRIFDYGFYIKKINDNNLLFSERLGLKGRSFLGFHFGILKPRKVGKYESR